MNERKLKPGSMFDKTFGRLGEVLNPARFPKRVEEYSVTNLGNGNIPEADLIVRQVESDFASRYDEISLTTPGMRDMAEKDTALLEEWFAWDIKGKRILEIGPGTGRITLPFAEAVGPEGKIYAVETARPYFDVLASKAALAGLDPKRLKLGVGDFQSIPFDRLMEFTNGPVDLCLMWFGPFALMPTNPQEVLEKCAKSLILRGQFAMSTNSLDGLAYRIPEMKMGQGTDPNLPLGYKPSIATRRKFDPESGQPIGMILADGSTLPARFYRMRYLQEMIEATGLLGIGLDRITRLTGLFPANPEDPEAMEKYIELVGKLQDEFSSVRPYYPKLDPSQSWETNWDIIKTLDKESEPMDQFVYLVSKATKYKE